MTIIFFLKIIGSASGKVGPFAASAIILHWSFSASFALIWFSSAPGTKISHLVVSNSSVEIFLLPEKLITEVLKSTEMEEVEEIDWVSIGKGRHPKVSMPESEDESKQ